MHAKMLNQLEGNQKLARTALKFIDLLTLFADFDGQRVRLQTGNKSKKFKTFTDDIESKIRDRVNPTDFFRVYVEVSPYCVTVNFDVTHPDWNSDCVNYYKGWITLGSYDNGYFSFTDKHIIDWKAFYQDTLKVTPAKLQTALDAINGYVAAINNIGETLPYDLKQIVFSASDYPR